MHGLHGEWVVCLCREMTVLLMEWSGAAFMKVRREQGQ